MDEENNSTVASMEPGSIELSITPVEPEAPSTPLVIPKSDPLSDDDSDDDGLDVLATENPTMIQHAHTGKESHAAHSHGTVSDVVSLKTYGKYEMAAELGLSVPQLYFAPRTGDALQKLVTDATPIRQKKPDEEDQGHAAGKPDKEQLEHRDDVAKNRFARIQPVDKAAQQLKKKMKIKPAEWSKDVLLENETVIGELPTIGFFGLPGQPNSFQQGKGMLLLTQLCGLHRMHFLTQADFTKLDCEEHWRYNNVTNYAGDEVTSSETDMSIQAKYSAHRSTTVTTSNLNVEGNLFHCHGTFEDKANIVEQLKGGYKHSFDCCGTGCDWLSCCTCKWCNCFDCECFTCCKTTQSHEEGSWNHSVTAIADDEPVEVNEDSQEAVALLLPEWDPNDPKAPAQTSGVRYHASKLEMHHMIHLTYRESSTDEIATCSALLSKHADIKAVTGFVSQMGRLCTAPTSERAYRPVSMPSEEWSSWPSASAMASNVAAQESEYAAGVETLQGSPFKTKRTRFMIVCVIILILILGIAAVVVTQTEDDDVAPTSAPTSAPTAPTSAPTAPTSAPTAAPTCPATNSEGVHCAATPDGTCPTGCA